MICWLVKLWIRLTQKIIKLLVIIINGFIEIGNPITGIFGTSNPLKHEFSEFKAGPKGSFIRQWMQLFIPRLSGVIFKILHITDKNHIRICKSNRCSEHDEHNEYWMYLNGIGSTPEIYDMNADYLEKIFDKHIEGVYNRTDSIWMDILEAFIDKETDIPSEPTLITLPRIINALYKYNKVVIIAHSQGTLIIGQVLNLLKDFDLDISLLKKLEIYAFGNVATKMKYVRDNYPYIETINNEFDIFTKLGPGINDKELKKLIDIDGDIYLKKGGYGHMLNVNYLNGFDPNYTDTPVYVNKYGNPSKLYNYRSHVKI